MHLSDRLKAVSDMVTSTGCLADVGTDHGYIPIYLIETNRCKKAIAMDINHGPLLRAKLHIRQKGLEEVIDTREGDGVASLKHSEADSVVIAGMGGGLIVHIMRNGQSILKDVSECILQPQSEIELVREFLQDEGYKIINENMILEDGKFYPMMRVVPGSMHLDSVERKYGPYLLAVKHPCLKAYLDKEELKFRGIRQQLLQSAPESAANRIKEIEEELSQIKEAKERIR